MQELANQSKLLRNNEILKVYSGIRTDIFIPYLRDEVRQKYGIPLNVKVVLIGSASLSDEYKGGKYIINVLEKCIDEIYVISFGSLNGFSLKNNKIKLINLGYIKNDQDLAKIYSIANVYFAPAINEAFGKTVAEAQSCGIPVLCFSETGPSDIVEHFKTGYLSTKYEITDLINGLNYCLNYKFDPLYIRSRTVNLFDIDTCASKYQEIYKSSFYKSNYSI
jgi:glycosyltransferase involved in cell wall biosynthesis